MLLFVFSKTDDGVLKFAKLSTDWTYGDASQEIVIRPLKDIQSVYVEGGVPYKEFLCGTNVSTKKKALGYSKFDNNILNWYVTGVETNYTYYGLPDGQLNVKGKTYYYYALTA